MARYKLTEDEIKWILSVESNEAQQEIRKLTKTNRELERANKDRRQEMIKLEMQGKKESAAYKNLSAEVKKNTAEISRNKAIMQELEKTLSINELTMSQLRKRSRELTRQLDNMSKSLHPEEYAKLEKELGDVKNRMGELRSESKITMDSLGKMIIGRGSIATFIGNMATKVAAFFGEGIRKAKEFIAEGTRIAGMAQGIDYAFNRIANKDYLDKLRAQTKGLVSDFTLMQSAVRAENFDIPLSKLGTLLEFAQNRARDTGESVDYLTQSIIDGIGRKSPLILDNLGISIVRIQEEVKKTGDFATAVGNIIEEEMAKSGDAIDTGADAATRKKVAWENLQLTVGKFFVNFRTGWDNISARFAEGMEKIFRSGDKATKVYDDQIKKVAELEVNVGSMAKRYDELKNKTKLNADEQKELNRIINDLSAAVPGVVTEFDKYGNALSINTQKVWQFIAAEKEKLKYMNRDALKQAEKDKRDKQRELSQVERALQAGTTSQAVGGNITGWVQNTTRDLIDVERESLLKQQAALKGELEGINSYIKELNGSTIEEQINHQKKSIEMRAEFNGMNQKELAAWIADERNAKNEYLAIAQEVYNARFSGGDGGGNSGGSGSGSQTPQWKKDLQALDMELAEKRLKLKEDRANQLLTESQHKTELEKLEREYLFKKMDIANLDKETQMSIQDKIFEYKIRMLEEYKKIENDYFESQQRMIDKQNKERDKQNSSLQTRIAKTTDKQLKEEFELRAAANKKMVDLTTGFATEVGQIVGGAVSGNNDMVKDSIVSMINMALDYLKIKAQLAMTETTLTALAQPDSVATFGAAGFARALIINGLIEAAFQSVKAAVSGIASKIGSSSTSTGTGSIGTTRVLAGRESGGYLDVERAQDGRRYRATYAPGKRGYVDRPTVIVGEGAQSREWVAPNDALQNPTIAPLIDLLEQSRIQGNIRTIDLNQIMRARMAGFASGGYISEDASPLSLGRGAGGEVLSSQSPVTQSDKTLIELNKTLKKLQTDGVSVNYQQFDKAKNRIEGIKSKAARQ